MHNKEIEEALLCSVIREPDNIDLVKRWIETDDVFYNDFNKEDNFFEIGSRDISLIIFPFGLPM